MTVAVLCLIGPFGCNRNGDDDEGATPPPPPPPSLPPPPIIAVGILDSSFDGDGIATTMITSNFAHLWDVVIQPDGKIVVAGVARTGSDQDIDRCVG